VSTISQTDGSLFDALIARMRRLLVTAETETNTDSG
jgi:hypothetical protein